MQTRSEFKLSKRIFTLRNFISAVIVFILGAVVFTFTASQIIPLRMVVDRFNDKLKEKGIVLSEGSFEKSFPFGVQATKLRFDKVGGGEIVEIERMRADLDILKTIIAGRPRIVFYARISSNDEIKGEIFFGWRGTLFDIELKDVNFKSIPAFTSYGLNISGTFNGNMSIDIPRDGCPSGYVRIKSDKLEDVNISVSGLPLPAGRIYDAGLSAKLRDCNAEVEGLWVDGNLLSARVQGKIAIATPFENSPLDLTVGITTKGDEKDYLRSFLEKYRKSANYYSIPLKGTVAHPATG